MANQTWALDLGEWSLKVVRGTVDATSGDIAVDLCDEIRYAELGLAEDASSLEKFRAGLRVFGDKHDLAAGDNLCVAVSGSEVFSRFINLPPVPESISEIIRYEARQQIPFDINEVVWDYQPLKEEHLPGEEIEVGLFALKRETVNEFMAILEPWRRNLRIIQNAPLAAYNFLRFEGWVDEPLIVLDVGAHTTDVLILNHPRFWIRPLLTAGNDITERLKSHFGISTQEAERVKARASESAHEAQVLRVIRPVVANMVSEIQRSLGYYKSLARGVKFNKVLTMGNSFKLRGLDKLLAEGLQYEIQQITELKRFKPAPPLSRAEFDAQLGGARTALGLLVQGLGLGHVSVNLVPEEVVAAMAISRKKPWLAGAVAAFILMGVTLFGSERAHGKDVIAQSAAGEKTNEEVDRLRGLHRTAASQTKEIEGNLQKLASSAVDRDVWLQVIPAVAAVFPEDVVSPRIQTSWLDSQQLAVAKKQGILKRSVKSRDWRPAAEALPAGIRTPELGEVGAGMPPQLLLSGTEDEPGGEIPRGEGAPVGRTPSTAVIRGAGGELRKSNLVLALACESTRVKGAQEYIEKELTTPLRELKFEKDGRPMFREVALIGPLTFIHRDSRTGRRVDKLIPETGQARQSVLTFVSFEIVAQVNVGAGAAQVAEASRTVRR